jgi:hypothetical protein
MRDSVETTCGCLIFAGATCGFGVTVILGFLFPAAAWISGTLAAVTVALASVVLWKYHHQADLAPDLLANVCGGRYAEVDGFCFVFRPTVTGRELRMQVHYQNRHDRPLGGSLRLSPNGFFKAGISEIETPINCGAGECGILDLPWPIAAKYSGKKWNFTVWAKVTHPLGRGQSLRFRNALAVRSGRTCLTVRLPSGFDENAPSVPPGSRVLWTLGEPTTGGFTVDPAQ